MSVSCSIVVFIAILAVILVVCIKKKHSGKVGNSDPSIQEAFKDVDTESTEEEVRPKNLALLHERVVTKIRAVSPSRELLHCNKLLSGMF